MYGGWKRGRMWQWRLWIRPLIILGFLLGICALLPLAIINVYNRGFTQSDTDIFISGIFVLMALQISLWEIGQHLVHYHQPFLQKHIIRILWMVPIYAVFSILGLIYPMYTVYIDSVRECYEAYVIYNFMIYLLNYLNSESNLIASLEQREQVHHIFPLCCLPDWKMGREILEKCKHGMLQFIVVRPLTAAISLLCELGGVYGENIFLGDVAFPYLLAVNHLSQFIAMYSLIFFYRVNRDALRPMSPLGKFFAIKAVVFFSFNQKLVIQILVYYNVMSSTPSQVRLVASQLQNFLICVEMFLAAILHHCTFSYKPFCKEGEEELADVLGCWDALTAMLDVSDIQRDLGEHVGVVGSSLSKSRRSLPVFPNEKSCLLGVEKNGDPECGYSSSAINAPSTSYGVIDTSATEAEKYIVTEVEVNTWAPPRRSILVDSPDVALIDLAPDVDYSDKKYGLPIA